LCFPDSVQKTGRLIRARDTAAHCHCGLLRTGGPHGSHRPHPAGPRGLPPVSPLTCARAVCPGQRLHPSALAVWQSGSGQCGSFVCGSPQTSNTDPIATPTAESTHQVSLRRRCPFPCAQKRFPTLALATLALATVQPFTPPLATHTHIAIGVNGFTLDSHRHWVAHDESRISQGRYLDGSRRKKSLVSMRQ